MRYFITCILLSLFFTDNGLNGFSYGDLPKDCGTTKYKDVDFLLSGVTSALLGEFPWIARVGVTKNKKTYFYCSGSLIHPSYVITAAHCGSQSNIIRLGENNLKSKKDCECDKCAPPYQDIFIEDHIFSNHCRKSNTNDMSLLSLEKPAKLNDFVRPICLPANKLPPEVLKKQQTFSVGWGVTYSGWGMIDGSKLNKERDLEYVYNNIIDSEKCNENYIQNLEENELCVAYPEEVAMPCVADSGSPLMAPITTNATNVTRKFIIGLASHDLHLCRNGDLTPVIYTDVSSHVKWIIRKIDQNMKSKS